MTGEDVRADVDIWASDGPFGVEVLRAFTCPICKVEHEISDGGRYDG